LVEGFLKRGYAVVHLWRQGSASPYGRLLSQSLGISHANHGVTCDSLGLLFAGTDTDQEEEMVKAERAWANRAERKQKAVVTQSTSLASLDDGNFTQDKVTATMFQPEAFLTIGKELMLRFTVVVLAADLTRFRSMFGTSPENCARLWKMIDPFASMPNGVHPRHLLWALMFLKLYCAESVLCTLAGGKNGAVDEKTFRKWCWLFVESISDMQYSVVSAKNFMCKGLFLFPHCCSFILSSFKILWANRLRGDIGNACKVSVDGTDFRIFNWKPFWSGWFSHKFKGPGVRYEVGLCIRTGDIVWINGPFPCGQYPDITIF